MALIAFIKGIIIGFVVAAPVGPVWLLCMRRTIEKGRLSGFVSGTGAATADAFYGTVAALGITSVANFLAEWNFILHISGGILLVYFGYRMYIRKLEMKEKTNGESFSRDYVSTFLLTMTNPTTIISFAAVFAAFGVSKEFGYIGALISGVSVFIGSSLWWLFLAETIRKVNEKWGLKAVEEANRITAVILIIIGFVSIGSVL